MGTGEVDDLPLFADYRVACIGPAGENRVYSAVVASNAGTSKTGRSGYNGRGGAGAVMGAKRLKAIAVRGTRKPVISEESKSFRKRFASHVLDADKFAVTLTAAGTATYAEINERGALRSHTQLVSLARSRPVASVGGEAVAAHLAGSDGCYNCPVRCGKRLAVDPDLGGDLSWRKDRSPRV